MNEASMEGDENHVYTVSMHETEGVKALFSGHPKMRLKAIISVIVACDHLRICMVAKDRTDMCKRHFPSHSEKTIIEG
jgi:hypothetical protein